MSATVMESFTVSPTFADAVLVFTEVMEGVLAVKDFDAVAVLPLASFAVRVNT